MPMLRGKISVSLSSVRVVPASVRGDLPYKAANMLRTHNIYKT